MKLAFAFAIFALPAAAVTVVDPIPFGCDTAASYIRHDQMVASMAAKFHGAKVLLSGSQFDATGRKIEVYWDPVDDVLIPTLVTRSLNTAKTSWQTLASSPTCVPDPSQPVPLP